ncbi:L-rhamnose operon regulatory protein rhaS [Listeria grayi]|uniref:AraC family transcriptional regulator n=1 Tax=Listeria grayi TaxID=1641 RepID=UPI000F714AD2|nr:AraC family transcriptional regulator [Listeria grayi]VEI36059.1 L-rhamnose operon regulatory protein rhaS [Listeria grayi]
MSIPNDYHVDIKQIRTHISEDEPGTKLLFVIQGELLATVAEQTYQLAADDILIINRRTPYVIQSDGDNVVIVLTISDSFFAHYDVDYFHCVFECFSKELDHGREKIVASLRRHLSEIVMIDMEKKAEHRLELESALLQILLLLTRFFKSELSLKEERKNRDSRISRIIQRLQDHYDEPITLNELASREYLSSTYLSRYFKKVTGYGFLQYLTEVRLKHALQDLIYSSHSITEIAFKNGFSSQKHFQEAFWADANYLSWIDC